MRLHLTSYALLLCLAAGMCAGTAPAADKLVSDRNAAHKFATLPDGVRFPEGIAANPATGEVYVATFDFQQPNKLLRYSRDGRLLAVRDFGVEPLLGLAFSNGHVYIANVGNLNGAGPARIQRIAAGFDSATPLVNVAVLPSIGAPANRISGNPDGSSDTIIFGSNLAPAPNAMAFDAGGNLYVSDSFQGAIFRINNATTCATPCPVVTVKHDPLLATAGFPPFGANGIALNAAGSALFVANTGDDTILMLDIASNVLSGFAQSINGADGIAFDGQGRLWVAANQGDEVVALNGSGRVIARLGEFQGINHDGTPDGLLFPASLAIVGDDMYVTNLALPLTPAVGDEPEEDVTRWTVSRIKLPGR
jgi:DNA-binding beta-propeller fold protein YncE